MDAIKVEDKKVSFTPERCIGCGVCVHKCPQKAIFLVYREGEQQDFPVNLKEWADRLLKERGHDPEETFKKNTLT